MLKQSKQNQEKYFGFQLKHPQIIKNYKKYNNNQAKTNKFENENISKFQKSSEIQIKLQSLIKDKESKKELLEIHKYQLSQFKQMYEGALNQKNKILFNARVKFEKQLNEIQLQQLVVKEQTHYISDKQIALQFLYDEHLEQKAMMKEELNGKLIQRAEMVANKEEFEQLIEQFKYKNNDEYMFIMEINNLQMDFEEQALQLQKLNQDQISNYQKILQNIHYDKVYSIINFFQKIKEVKDIILNENNIQQEIFNKLSQCFQTQYSNNEIIIHQQEVILMELQNYQNVGDTQKIEKLNYANNSLKEIIEIINENKNKEGIIDIEIIQDYFYQYLKQQIKDIEKQKYLYNAFKNYIHIYIDHQKQMEGKIKEEQQIQQNIKQLYIFDNYENVNDQEIKSIKQQQKSITEQIEQMKIILEQSLIEQCQEAFIDYLNSQQNIFDQILKTYGSQICENLKKEHYLKFFQIMQENQLKRMQKYKQMSIDLKNCESQITSNIKYVDNEVLIALKSVLQQISELKQQIIQVKKEQIKVNERNQTIEKQISEINSNIKQFEAIQLKQNGIDLEQLEEYEIKIQGEQHFVEAADQEIEQIENQILQLGQIKKILQKEKQLSINQKENKVKNQKLVYTEQQSPYKGFLQKSSQKNNKIQLSPDKELNELLYNESNEDHLNQKLQKIKLSQERAQSAPKLLKNANRSLQQQSSSKISVINSGEVQKWLKQVDVITKKTNSNEQKKNNGTMSSYIEILNDQKNKKRQKTTQNNNRTTYNNDKKKIQSKLDFFKQQYLLKH